MTNPDHLDQAADWLDRLDELDAQGKDALSQWLSVVEHQRAFTRIANAVGQQEVALAAISTAKRNNLALSEKNALRSPSGLRHYPPRQTPWFALAAGFTVVTALVIWLGLHHHETVSPASAPLVAAQSLSQSLQLSSDTAHTASRVLHDGSVVYLNGNSQLSVNHTDNFREVSLDKGEAYFDVAKDPERPFIVNIGAARVQVVGTAFDIDRLTNRTIIRVYEGVVRVFADKSLTLVKGEGAIIESGHWHHTFRLDDSQLPGWRSGWLDVRNEPLAVVVEKLSRYLDKPVNIDGDMTIPVSGRFSLANAANSLALIATTEGLSLQEQDKQYLLTVRQH